MAELCLYLHLHLPRRLRRSNVFKTSSDLFDGPGDRERLARTSAAVFLPVHALLLEGIRRFGRGLRVRLWMSGLLLEQAEESGRALLDSLFRLRDTGRVEWLAESYYHSLAFLFAPQEFNDQVELHRVRVREVFGLDTLNVDSPGELRRVRADDGTDRPLEYQGSGKSIHGVVDYEQVEQYWAKIAELLDQPPRSSPGGELSPAKLGALGGAVGSIACQTAAGRYLNGSLSGDAAQALFALTARVRRPGDLALLNVWRRLQAADHFSAMALDPAAPGAAAPDAADGIPRRRAAGFTPATHFGARTVDATGWLPHPYEYYIYFMTALDRVAERC